MAYEELKGHRDLKVYQLAYKLAMEIFHETKVFPKRRALFIDRSDSPLFEKCCRKYCRRFSQKKISKNVPKQTRRCRR